MFLLDATEGAGRYTLSLHDALPIFGVRGEHVLDTEQRMVGDVEAEHLAFVGKQDRLLPLAQRDLEVETEGRRRDRKSTRLNSSHSSIPYAVFCLKKKTRAYAQVSLA